MRQVEINLTYFSPDCPFFIKLPVNGWYRNILNPQQFPLRTLMKEKSFKILWNSQQSSFIRISLNRFLNRNSLSIKCPIAEQLSRRNDLTEKNPFI